MKYMNWTLVWEDKGIWTVRQPSGGDLESNIADQWEVTYKIYMYVSNSDKPNYELIITGADAKDHTLYAKAIEKLNELNSQL